MDNVAISSPMRLQCLFSEEHKSYLFSKQLLTMVAHLRARELKSLSKATAREICEVRNYLILKSGKNKYFV